jgi:hypothetical protein
MSQGEEKETERLNDYTVPIRLRGIVAMDMGLGFGAKVAMGGSCGAM